MARGRELFAGRRALRNGGAACAGCHTVGGVGRWRAGTLAGDLTRVFDKYQDTGLARALAESRFPLMFTAYHGRPLTADEVFALRAFLCASARSLEPPVWNWPRERRCSWGSAARRSCCCSPAASCGGAREAFADRAGMMRDFLLYGVSPYLAAALPVCVPAWRLRSPSCRTAAAAAPPGGPASIRGSFPQEFRSPRVRGSSWRSGSLRLGRRASGRAGW